MMYTIHLYSDQIETRASYPMSYAESICRMTPTPIVLAGLTELGITEWELKAVRQWSSEFRGKDYSDHVNPAVWQVSIDPLATHIKWHPPRRRRKRGGGK